MEVVTTLGPRKPQRSSSTNPQKCWDEDVLVEYSPPPYRLYLETSFTSLHSPSGAPSNASSITNGYYSSKCQPSSPVFSKMLASKQTPSPTLDLIHDDWLGLAPLASPESLSEVSSISSRTSVLITQTTVCEINTPKVLRRTPKIIGNLSTCADDIRNVRNFEMAKIFWRGSNNESPAGSNSSSNLSFESATSSSKCNIYGNDTMKVKCCDGSDRIFSGESDDFQSAEDILDNVLTSAGCKDFFSSSACGLLETNFDLLEDLSNDRIVQSSSSTTQDMDPDLISNFAIDLNLDEQHRSLQFTTRNTDSSKPNSIDSGSICRTPSETKNVTFNPQVINIDTSVVSSVYSPSRRHWRIFKGRKHKSLDSGTSRVVSAGQPIPKTILCMKRRNSEEECFTRTEGLPLLSGLNVSSERTSPNFVRRKKYIYPIERSVKGESSV